MDTNPPKNQDDVNATDPASSQPAGPPAVSNPPVGAEITPAQPAAAPETVAPAEPPVESPAEPVSSPPAPAETASAAPAAVPASVKPAHSSNKPMGAIVAAIVIALLLAGLSIFAYLKTRNAVQPISGTNRSSGTPATPQDADKTSEELDKTLGTIDNQDMGSDLSDSAIGL